MNTKYRSIIIWLIIVSIMVFVMVMIGGITRLTDSGLSMVDWRPLMGSIPPLSETEWLRVFNDYKNFPEFQKINSLMTLPEFKKIFFWEYFHRLWGRLIGLAFFIPYLIFLIRGKLNRGLNIKLLIALVLGGSQGVLGWYMVKSGLVDRPDVSHFRLAAHLGLAFIIIGYISWIIFGLTENKDMLLKKEKKIYRVILVLLSLVSFQIIYGAFVAGLDAGVGYNTFPLMGRSFMPSAVFSYASMIDNFLENRIMIQFIHRMGGWSIFLFSFILIFYKKKITNPLQSRALKYIILMIHTQFLLGVLTIVYSIPLSIALLHQLGACVLLIFVVNAMRKFNPQFN